MAKDIGIDLGTNNIKIYSRNDDAILMEKNMIAIENKSKVFAYGDSVRLHAHDCVECVRDFARVGKTANSAHHDGHKRIKHFITFETVPFNDIAQVNCFVEERWLFKSCEDTSFVKGGCFGCFRPKIRSAA